MKGVDAFVQVGRIVAEHGDRQQNAEDQQDADGDIETPGATIRHGAGPPGADDGENLMPRFR
jgi:hypothetical protein